MLSAYMLCLGTKVNAPLHYGGFSHIWLFVTCSFSPCSVNTVSKGIANDVGVLLLKCAPWNHNCKTLLDCKITLAILH